MTLHEDSVRLRHMLDHGREAVEMVRGRTRTELDSDRQFNLALVRLLEIVGEAAETTCSDLPPMIRTLERYLLELTA